LIAVFFTAQYARQFAYLQCKLVSITSVGQQDCDCGKVSDINKVADDGHPASKGHIHLTLDDFFAQPVNSQQESFVTEPNTLLKVAYQSNICQGCANAIERPPQVA